MEIFVAEKFIALIKTLRERYELSQEDLGAALGATQKSIWDWENGTKPRMSSLRKIAKFLGRDVETLQVFLSEASSQSVDDFLAGLPGRSRPSAFNQVITNLPALSRAELVEVGRRVFELLFSTLALPSLPKMAGWSEPFEDDALPSISRLVLCLGDYNKVMKLSRHRLEQLSAGDRPSDHDLVQLALILKKADGTPWTTQELMLIRDRDFPHQHSEEQTNGV